MHTKKISFQPARFAQYDSLWKLPLLHPKTQILLLPFWPQWGEILYVLIFMPLRFHKIFLQFSSDFIMNVSKNFKIQIHKIIG